MTEDAKLTDFLEDERVESEVADAEVQEVESTGSSDESTESPDEVTESPDEATTKLDESTESPDEATANSDDQAEITSGTVEPAVATYAWGTYRCSRCEVVTNRVWRSNEEFVCPDCKQW